MTNFSLQQAFLSRGEGSYMNFPQVPAHPHKMPLQPASHQHKIQPIIVVDSKPVDARIQPITTALLKQN